MTHEVFTIRQSANCTEDGELTVGSWEAQRPEESETFVHLTTSSPRKWMAMLSSTAVRGYGELKNGRVAFVDSGESFLAGPAEEAGKILVDLVKKANLRNSREVVRSTEAGISCLYCDDAQYLPDVIPKFSTSEGTVNTFTMRHQHLAGFRRRKGPFCTLKIEGREDTWWTLGVLLFMNRTLHFGAHQGRIGLVF